MSNEIGSGKAKGLIEYLDQLVEKGRSTAGAVSPLKTAVRSVLSVVDGEDKWVETDIKALDTEDYISRFKNMTLGKYNASSYSSYFARLNRAKEWYTTFLTNPGWAPPKRNSSVQTKGMPDTKNKVKPKNEEMNSNSDTLVSTTNLETRTNPKNDLVAFPFPLRNGTMVSLYLPINLPLSEAKRIGKFVESLSIGDDEAN